MPRQGKLVTAGHTTFVDCLRQFLIPLEDWPEIHTIRVGRLVNARVRTRRKQYQVVGIVRRRSVGLGGGFSFRVGSWARVGEMVTGIRCKATYGRTIQEVILTSHDYSALWARLRQEGYADPE